MGARARRLDRRGCVLRRGAEALGDRLLGILDDVGNAIAALGKEALQGAFGLGALGLVGLVAVGGGREAHLGAPNLLGPEGGHAQRRAAVGVACHRGFSRGLRLGDARVDDRIGRAGAATFAAALLTLALALAAAVRGFVRLFGL